jgi:hypothetical protein
VDKIVKILENFGANLVQDLQASLRRKGVTYGGGDSRLSNNIKFKIIKGEDKISVQLLMPDYGFVLDKGRGETKSGGKGETKTKISEWVKRRNMVKKFQQSTLKARVDKQNESKRRNPNRKYKTLKQVSFEKAAQQLGYLVSRKIHKQGYKGNHFYTDVINRIETGELSKQVSEIIKQDIIIEIRK